MTDPAPRAARFRAPNFIANSALSSPPCAHPGGMHRSSFLHAVRAYGRFGSSTVLGGIELAPLHPGQRTCSDYFSMWVSCHERTPALQ